MAHGARPAFAHYYASKLDTGWHSTAHMPRGTFERHTPVYALCCAATCCAWLGAAKNSMAHLSRGARTRMCPAVLPAAGWPPASRAILRPVLAQHACKRHGRGCSDHKSRWSEYSGDVPHSCKLSPAPWHLIHTCHRSENSCRVVNKPATVYGPYRNPRTPGAAGALRYIIVATSKSQLPSRSLGLGSCQPA